MKIKLTETQIQKVLKEVGGYDSLDIMGIHGGSVQGEITRIVSQTVDFMKARNKIDGKTAKMYAECLSTWMNKIKHSKLDHRKNLSTLYIEIDENFF